MSYNVRMLAPAVAKSAVKHGNGQSFNDAPGTSVDYVDHVAQLLEANGYTRVAQSGTTAQRPTNNTIPILTKGMFYVDTTLTQLIQFDGATWRNPISGASV